MKKIIGMLLLVGLLAGMLAGCGVQRPAIKEAKFDFTVTYELDGAVKTVSGVYACKYDGISWALDSGRTRSWKGQVEGVETTGVGDDIKLGTTEDGGNIILALAFYPSYFMGDMEMEAPVPYLVVEYPAEEGRPPGEYWRWPAGCAPAVAARIDWAKHERGPVFPVSQNLGATVFRPIGGTHNPPESFPGNGGTAECLKSLPLT